MGADPSPRAAAADKFSFMVELLGWPTLLLENTVFLLPNPARLHCDALRGHGQSARTSRLQQTRATAAPTRARPYRRKRMPDRRIPTLGFGHSVTGKQAARGATAAASDEGARLAELVGSSGHAREKIRLKVPG